MTSLSPAVKSKEITLRLKGSGKDLSVSWESKKADEILVRDIIDIKTEGTGKSGESRPDFFRFFLHFLPFLP